VGDMIMLLDTMNLRGNDIEFVIQGKTKGKGKYTILGTVEEIFNTHILITVFRATDKLRPYTLYSVRNFFFKVLKEKYIDRIMYEHIYRS
jgi:hypothetical protein